MSVRDEVRKRAHNKCELCHREGTKADLLNMHHVKGKRYNTADDIMLVHSRSCHMFAQWVTNLYLLNGAEKSLTRAYIKQVFIRTVTLQTKGEWLLPFYR